MSTRIIKGDFDEAIDSNPSKSFEDFSYNVVNESLDDLKQDIIVLDESVKNGLSTKWEKPSTSELAVRDLYVNYSEKLGMKIGYTNFREYIEHVAENNKVQRDIIEAVNAKIASDISQRQEAKLLITLNTLIDRSTTMILRMTEGENAEFTPELVGMVDKCMQWMQQLNEIRDEALSKVSDPDRTIDKIKEKYYAKQNAVSSKTDGNSKAIEQTMINDLVDSLRLGYTN